MKASATILALLLVAGSAFAQEARRTDDPDYSRNRLMRLFVEANVGEDDRRIEYRRGSVRFRALGTTWRMAYVPLMALSGTGFGSTDVMQQWPDPFALTGTQIATSPRAWRTRRDLNAEMRRIERTERERARVEVTVGR